MSETLYGAIVLGHAQPIEQNVGAVYGICAVSQSPIQHAALLPDLSLVPVCWGKDITPASRVKAHAQAHQNGNVGLPNIPSLQGLPLYYGAILVERYEQFEALLHTHFRPLVGTPRQGRVAQIVRVIA